SRRVAREAERRQIVWLLAAGGGGAAAVAVVAGLLVSRERKALQAQRALVGAQQVQLAEPRVRAELANGNEDKVREAQAYQEVLKRELEERDQALAQRDRAQQKLADAYKELGKKNDELRQQISQTAALARQQAKTEAQKKRVEEELQLINP